MTKKKAKGRSMHMLAHSYASRRHVKRAPKEWSDSERGTYWWGLYEGYQAGVRAARRNK
jgi:hypothetical protein